MIKRGIILGLALAFLIGINFLFVFTGNASEGSTISNVSIAGLRIIYSNFDGNTTAFDSKNTSELENLSNMTLEKIAYGKVVFNERVNLSLVAGSDRLINFNEDLLLTSNSISIDNVDLPYLNKSVNITLKGLSFTDPQIMKNGANCTDCVELNYSGGIMTFSTSVFYGAYFIRETPVPEVCGNGVCGSGETTTNCPGDCGTGDDGGDEGGGGGGGETTNGTVTPEVASGANFYVQPTFFTAELRKGAAYEKQIMIVNNGTQDLVIGIAILDLQDFIFPEVQYVTLKKGESTNVTMHIYISESRDADVYVGKILFRNSEVSRETRVVLDVKERYALFDIRANMLKRYVNPGGTARANVSIINMGDKRNFDVSLEYKILDFDNNEYVIKKEDFAINDTFTGTFELDLPENLALGDYLFYTRVYAGNVSASSYDTFTLEKISWLAWILLILVILIIMIVILIKIAKDREWLWFKNSEKDGESVEG